MKRSFFFGIILTVLGRLAVPVPAYAAPTFIQSCAATSNGAGAATCTLVGVGAGHLLVLAVYNCGALVAQYIAPDTFGLTYQGMNGGGATNTGPFGCNFRIRGVNIYTVNSGANSGNDTMTVSADGVVNVTNAFVFVEYSLTSSQDGNSAFATGGNEPGPINIATPNLTTNFSGALLVSAGESSCEGLPPLACNQNTMTAGAGYTIRGSIAITNDGNGAGFLSIFYLQDKIAGAAGNYAADFNQSLNAMWGWEVVVAAFGAQSSLTKHIRAQEY